MSLQAIDISSNNGRIDPSQVTAPIIINKLTGGLDYVWKNNLIDECLKAGKLVGAYHFEDEYNIHSKIKLQAQKFYKEWKKYKGRVLPILDYEVPLNGKIFTQHDINRIEMFMKEFKRLSGVNAVLYCSKSLIWNHTINDYIKKHNMVWFAQYADNKPTGYQQAPWTDNNKLDVNIVGQQYTSNGFVRGVHGAVDLSIFYISRANWLKSC